MSPHGLTPRTAWPVALLIGLAGAAYAAWVLEVVLSTGLNPIETYVSELAAQDQPLGGLFRATDFTAGLLAFGGGMLALIRLLKYTESQTVAVQRMLGFGAPAGWSDERWLETMAAGLSLVKRLGLK